MAKLRFALRKFTPFEKALEECFADYKKLNPQAPDIEFVAMDLEELYDALFEQKGLQNGDWDIVHINTDWISQAHHMNGLTPLNSFLERKPIEGGTESWAESLMDLQRFDGMLYGLPFHDGPECLVYRRDLFDDIQLQEEYASRYGKPLNPPTTWDEFLSVAEFFTRPEQQLYGSVFAGYPDGHNAVFDFCIQLWSRGGALVNSFGDIVIDQPIAIEALDFYRSLFKSKRYLHPNSSSYESVAAGDAFARGEVAMMVNWFGFASWAHIDNQSAVKGRVDVTSIPTSKGGASASLNVYWLYALAAGSTQKDVAYDFLQFAVNAHNDKKLTLAGGVGCRYSTWEDREINELIPFYSKLAELHHGAQTLPRTRNWSQIAHHIDLMVGQAIASNEESSALLARAQQTINELK